MSNEKMQHHGQGWAGGEIAEAHPGEDYSHGYADSHHPQDPEGGYGAHDLGYGGAYGDEDELPQDGDGYGGPIPALDPEDAARARPAAAAPRKKTILGFHPYVVYSGCAVSAVLMGASLFMKNMAAPPPPPRPQIARPAPAAQPPERPPQQAQAILQPAPQQPLPPAQQAAYQAPQLPPQGIPPQPAVSAVSEERFSRLDSGLAEEASRITADEARISSLDGKVTGLDGRVAALETQTTALAGAPARTAPAPPVRAAAAPARKPHRAHAAPPRHVPSAADEEAVLQAMAAKTPAHRTGAALALDAVTGKTAWLSAADGESKPYTINSSVPGWGRVIQIRRNLSDMSVWEVVTENGVASSGRE